MRVAASLWLLVSAVFLLAVVGTWLQRNRALRRGMLDFPNERSSHTIPTPRSGGLAIVFATMLGFLVLVRLDMLDDKVFRALSGGGCAIAVVGYLDDRFGLSPLLRLIVHVGAGSWVLFSLGGLASLSVGGLPLDLGWAGNVLAVIAIVWVINLFNFMDGIDGIAASEAIFVVLGAALVALAGPATTGFRPAALIFAASCAGFLVWNWSPAKIFMGDAGSGFLGFTVAALALAAARTMPIAVVVFLILGGVFFVDATTTLVRRMLRGEHFYQAHRIHAYQWLARELGSHSRVVLGVIAVNIAWLMPCAIFAAHRPRWALPVLGLALVPLVIVALVAGAGRRQDSQ